jgi:two-component system, chemotaxis family, CheB/CheR fusion protein
MKTYKHGEVDPRLNAPTANGMAFAKAIVGIGASAGGLNAYTALLSALKPDTGMAFVVVQHLAADHDSFLATLLSRVTQMPVLEVQDGPRVEPNTIYVIPPNRTLSIEDDHLRLQERQPGLHLPVDIFFKALAESHGPRAIGIILSGTGSDGTKGIAAIKAAGGITFAQDGTAQHWSMPQSAVSTGCIDFVLPPQAIASELAKLAAMPDVAFSSDPIEPAEELESIIKVLRASLKIDFSHYKETTLYRRIRRRMALRQLDSLSKYRNLLRDDPAEQQSLYQDILINVTSFFRDAESFEALKTVVFPQLITPSAKDEPLRIWVVACSSGEEAYSIAIAVLEYMDEVEVYRPLRIFGTDINAQSISRARRGWYSKESIEELSEARRKRYFVETDGGYCVQKSVRSLCTFAPHNAVTDPPFSRMDLVSCRNLLIYFQNVLQRRLLPLLHYALRPNGFLLLGSSESISQYRELFDQLDVRHKIYAARESVRPVVTIAPRIADEVAPIVPGIVKRALASQEPVDRQRIADLVVLKYYVPPGVLVDEEGEILHFRGDVSPYLAQSDGKPSHNLLKVAREGLFAPLRSALEQAANVASGARVESAVVKNSEGLTTVSINVMPVTYSGASHPMYWVLFEPSAETLEQRILTQARRLESGHDISRQIAVLTDELTATREHLESTIEAQAATNENLQAASEEVQSSNEELQSTNEELETSKEEIQSSNEELVTVNDELRLRNEELDRANDDLNNLFGSVKMAIVMVWQDLRIRRFTPLAQTLFNILPTDVGRSITDMRHNIEIEEFSELLVRAINQGVELEKQVKSSEGRSYWLRLRPYRTEDGAVDGAVVILIDIETLAQTQESLRKRIAELAAADRHKNEFLAILAHELRNPLAPLRNAVQILKASSGDAAITAKARDLIDRQVNHMSRLVGDLLDAARAENGQIRLQRAPLDLRACIEHVVDLLRPAFENKNQTLRMGLPEVPVWIEGDSIRLEQIFNNLLSNANKYTQERGNIEIELTPAIDNNGNRIAVTRVIDNGEGIDSELIPRLFDLFTQADRSLAHSQGGLGIGLSLVRTLVEMHHGSVIIRSEGRGRGSIFEVRLPTIEHLVMEEKQPEETTFIVPGAIQRRIMIVEDNQDIRESSCEALAMAGFEVTAAATGIEALENAPAFRPNAVLLDVGLPDLSGYDVARRLRENPQFASTLLIAMTGYDGPEARALSSAAGFDHHLTKPVDFDELARLLG